VPTDVFYLLLESLYGQARRDRGDDFLKGRKAMVGRDEEGEVTRRFLSGYNPFKNTQAVKKIIGRPLNLSYANRLHRSEL